MTDIEKNEDFQSFLSDIFKGRTVTITKDMKDALDKIYHKGLVTIAESFTLDDESDGYEEPAEKQERYPQDSKNVQKWLDAFKECVFKEVCKKILANHRKDIEASREVGFQGIKSLSKEIGIEISDEEINKLLDRENALVILEEITSYTIKRTAEEREKYIPQIEKMELEIQTLKNGNAELNRIIGEQAKTIEAMMLNERKLVNARFEPLTNESLKRIGCIVSNNTDNSGD